MSGFSLANLFATPAVAPVAAPVTPVATPVLPGNLPAAPIDLAAPVLTVDPNAPAPAPIVEPTAPDSPLDAYAKLWEPVTNEAGVTTTPDQLDPAKLQEIISKASFTGSLKPETMAAVAAGGEGAEAALKEVMNSVAQQTLMQATLASNAMQEQRIKAALEAHTASLPEAIRLQNTTNSLHAANPLFANPAVKPIIEAVQSQIAAKNPDATPAQLTEMAQNYVKVTFEALNPTAPVAPTGSEEINWETFLAPS